MTSLPSRRAPSSASAVYVVGAYVPNGGTVMAYHLARILHLQFGFAVIAIIVGEETPNAGVFAYDPVFPCLPLAELESTITPSDILICNPSFSPHNFGLKLDCLKIMYVQDFTTYSFIDRFFDHYVAVSDFVHDFLLSTYGLKTDVIPPFIAIPPDVAVPQWDERAPNSLCIMGKGDGERIRHLESRLRRRLRQCAPEIDLLFDWDSCHIALDPKIPHADLCRQLGSVRYLLSLTVSEGFGLIPLEAMAMGTAVVGFDAFGGRHYMRPGINCLARAYPDIEGVADDLIALVRNPQWAASIAQAGQRPADAYGYDRFRTAWERKFAAILAS
jgi:hypothetical protein